MMYAFCYNMDGCYAWDFMVDAKASPQEIAETAKIESEGVVPDRIWLILPGQHPVMQKELTREEDYQ